MSYYKRGCEPQNQRYILIAEDNSDIYKDTETKEILSDYAILERLNEQDKTIKKLKKENNELRQDNDLDTIFGISDEELTKRFEAAINRDKEICKSKGFPIAGYDNENKCAYLEYPDGKKEYIEDSNLSDFETTEKRFPTILNHVIFVDTGKKPSIEEIKNQLMSQEPLISDEEAFERHLIRKWKNE